VKIAFSTIAAPRLDALGVREALDAYGYDGVELYALRGGRLYPDVLADELEQLRGLPVVALNSFATLADGDHDQLVHALELGHELECPVVKAFGGEADDRDEKLRRAAETLARALPHAAELGVTIAVETHDGFSRGADVAALLSAVASDGAGALWDLQNSVAAGESVAETDDHIGAHVRHVHVKDGVTAGGTWKPVEMGDGELPVAELVRRLHARSYDGYLSFDHEKFWHDELAEPSSSLPRAAQILRDLIERTTGAAAA
jgi:sugar phosphate isomerase/epimerase